MTDELERIVARARAIVAAMTPAEREAYSSEQCLRIAVAEASWNEDATVVVRSAPPSPAAQPVTDLAAAIRMTICCEGRPCMRPERCDAHDRSQAITVRIPQAAEAVAKLLCDQWRAAGPMSRRRAVEREEGK